MSPQQGAAPAQRRNTAEVERLVEEFESSGLTRREFCRRRELAVWTLDAYRKRVRQRRDDTAGAGRFVAVEVTKPKPPETGALGGGVVLVLAGGRRIEVSRGFDAATLEQLLSLIGRA